MEFSPAYQHSKMHRVLGAITIKFKGCHIPLGGLTPPFHQHRRQYFLLYTPFSSRLTQFSHTFMLCQCLYSGDEECRHRVTTGLHLLLHCNVPPLSHRRKAGECSCSSSCAGELWQFDWTQKSSLTNDIQKPSSFKQPLLSVMLWKVHPQPSLETAVCW